MIGDLANRKLIFLKGFLFLIVGFSANILILIEAPKLKILLLMLITNWAFCRCYYFAFYVIEKYVDPPYRYSGLYSFARYLLAKKF